MGIGGAQVPKILKTLDEIKALKGDATLGGEALSLNPIASALYPEALSRADVQRVVDSVPALEAIRKNNAKTTYMSSLGYIERRAFLTTMEAQGGLNKLATYAVFDALTNGSGDYAAPQECESKLAAWRADGLDGFKSDLLKAQGAKLSAYSVFGFLILLVLDLIVESGANGWLN